MIQAMPFQEHTMLVHAPMQACSIGLLLLLGGGHKMAMNLTCCHKQGPMALFAEIMQQELLRAEQGARLYICVCRRGGNRAVSSAKAHGRSRHSPRGQCRSGAWT